MRRRELLLGAAALASYAQLPSAEAALVGPRRVLFSGVLTPTVLGPYLPTSPVPILIAGMRRYVAGYSGPAINVIRKSDSAPLDIFFNTKNDLLNYAALSAFTGGAECYVNIIYDQSGNGNHLTTTAGNANKPVVSINTGNMIGPYKTASLNFDGATRELITPAMSLTWNGVSTFIAVRPQSSATTGQFWNISATPLYNTLTAAGNPGLYVGQLSAGVNTIFPRCQPVTIGYISNAGGANGSLYLDGGAAHSVAGVSVNTITSAGTIGLGAFCYDFLAICFYNSAVSGTVASAVNSILAAPVARGNYQVVYDGDSITEGQGATYGQSLPSQVFGSLNHLVDMLNIGIPGNTAAAMAASYAANQSKTYNWDKTYTNNVYHLWGGTNDIHISGTTGANLWNNSVSPMMAAVVATGFVPVIGTLLPEEGETAGQTTQRIAYNALVLSSGYQVADYASQTIMGNIANCSNATYYSPTAGGVAGIHPTSVGYSLLAPICAAAINSVL